MNIWIDRYGWMNKYGWSWIEKMERYHGLNYFTKRLFLDLHGAVKHLPTGVNGVMLKIGLKLQ